MRKFIFKQTNPMIFFTQFHSTGNRNFMSTSAKYFYSFQLNVLLLGNSHQNTFLKYFQRIETYLKEKLQGFAYIAKCGEFCFLNFFFSLYFKKVFLASGAFGECRFSSLQKFTFHTIFLATESKMLSEIEDRCIILQMLSSIKLSTVENKKHSQTVRKDTETHLIYPEELTS